MKKPIVRVLLGAAFSIIILALVCNHNHPILLKWVVGEAKMVGKPVNATVYNDDIVSHDISVYKLNNNEYLLNLKHFDKYCMLRYIIVDVDDKLIARPIGSSDADYDSVMGTLFQSETGEHFVDFKNDMKGFNFDPQLSVTGKEIRFNVPPRYLKFDRIRVVLN